MTEIFSFEDLTAFGRKVASDEASTRMKQAREEKQAELEKMVKRSGIPPRFRGKGFDDYKTVMTGQTKARRYCEGYAGDFGRYHGGGVCMIMSGHSGTGKTHLACSILQQVLADGYTGLFLTVSEMLRTIRSTYSPSSQKTEQEVYDRYIGADLLILDEVGLAIGKDTTREVLIFDVINGRYAAQRPTVLLGNLKLREMQDYLGSRVWDRLQEGNAPVIAFDWESYRSNG